jgi:hypothetical protein
MLASASRLGLSPSPQVFTEPQTVSYATSIQAYAVDQCLDLDNGNFFKLQTWTCSSPDPQQQFIMV